MNGASGKSDRLGVTGCLVFKRKKGQTPLNTRKDHICEVMDEISLQACKLAKDATNSRSTVPSPFKKLVRKRLRIITYTGTGVLESRVGCRMSPIPFRVTD